jgi:carbamoyl-phosphate synthase large subunit
MGIDYNFGRAFFKAQLSADNLLPLTGTVFMSIRDVDKKASVEVARKLQESGLNLMGTRATARYLGEKGIFMEAVQKVHEGSPNVIDMLRRGDVGLIINTPTSRQSRRDGYNIRRAAVDYQVPYITTIQSAKAACEAIASMKKGRITIKSINEYHREALRQE